MKFQDYLFKLVKVSLITKSTSIAIRIHLKNKRLQIINNGIGIPYRILHQIGELSYEDDFTSDIITDEYKHCHETLLHFHDVTSTLIIMTKHQHCVDTFAKIFKSDCSSRIEQIADRPTCGITYTVYFNNTANIPEKIFSWQKIKNNISNLSIKYPGVSFSICSDDDQRIILGIRKNSKSISSKKHNHSVKRSYFSTLYDPTPVKFINYPLGNTFREVKKSFFKGVNFFPKNVLSSKKIFYINERRESKLNRLSFMIKDENEKKSNDKNKNSNHNNKNNERQCSFTITGLRSHNASNHNKDTKNNKNDVNNGINDNKNQCSFTTMDFKSHSILNNDDIHDINYSKNNDNININKGQCSFTITSLRSHSELVNNSDTKNAFNNNNNIINININDHKKESSSSRTDLKACSELNNYSIDIDQNNNNNDNNYINSNENVERICIEINPYDLDLSGEWSDWILDSPQNQLNKELNGNNKSNFEIINRKRYSFLPEKLNKLLPENNNKLSIRQLSDAFREKCNLKLNLPRRQDDDVRLCDVKRGKYAITMDKKIFKRIKVLNQVNFEFIACVAEQNDRKLLILIDQHAMDERIRYENLIDDYKTEDNKLLSITLKRSINITELPVYYVNLLLLNRKLLANFGIHVSDNYNTININNNDNSHGNATLSVSTVPKCLLAKKYKNNVDLIDSTRKLLIEIAEKLHINIGVNSLPLTIHNIIASEACHGAIKFGDPLSLKQCNDLLSYWIETDLPNRCAHGRPVVIPLLFIDSLDKSRQHVTKKRLNFDALNRNR